MLNQDHELIHAGIMNIVEAINAFLEAIQAEADANDDARRRAADRYIEASQLLHDRLERHLADEEDLIIPLMIRQES